MPPPLKPPQNAATALDRLLARAPRGTQAWVIGALGVGAALFLARWVGARQPLRSWLSLQLAAIWLWQAVLAAACASVGYRLATRALPARRMDAARTSRRRLSGRHRHLRPRRLRRGVPASVAARAGDRSPRPSAGDRRAAPRPPLARGGAGPVSDHAGRPSAGRDGGRSAAARRPLSGRDVAGRDQLRRELDAPGDRAGLRARGAHRPLPGRLGPEHAAPRKRPQHLVVPGARVRPAGAALDDGAAHGVRRRRLDAGRRRRGGAVARRSAAAGDCGRRSCCSPGSSSTTATSAARPITSSALFAAPLLLLTARALRRVSTAAPASPGACSRAARLMAKAQGVYLVAPVRGCCCACAPAIWSSGDRAVIAASSSPARDRCNGRARGRRRRWS